MRGEQKRKVGRPTIRETLIRERANSFSIAELFKRGKKERRNRRKRKK